MPAKHAMRPAAWACSTSSAVPQNTRSSGDDLAQVCMRSRATSAAAGAERLRVGETTTPRATAPSPPSFIRGMSACQTKGERGSRFTWRRSKR